MTCEIHMCKIPYLGSKFGLATPLNIGYLQRDNSPFCGAYFGM